MNKPKKLVIAGVAVAIPALVIYLNRAQFDTMTASAVSMTRGELGREQAGQLGLITLGVIGVLLAVIFLGWRIFVWIQRRDWWSVAELKQSLDAGTDVLAIDVRVAKEYLGGKGYVKGALNLPLEQLAERVSELERDRGRTIALLCRTDRRSAYAARLLKQRGFTDVHVVGGGMNAWLARGLPTESGRSEWREQRV